MGNTTMKDYAHVKVKREDIRPDPKISYSCKDCLV